MGTSSMQSYKSAMQKSLVRAQDMRKNAATTAAADFAAVKSEAAASFVADGAHQQYKIVNDIGGCSNPHLETHGHDWNGGVSVFKNPDNCVAAAKALGWKAEQAKAPAGSGHDHKVPIEVGGKDKGSCVICDNMIYAGRPNLLYHDMHPGAGACNQDGAQTKHFVCENKFLAKAQHASEQHMRTVEENALIVERDAHAEYERQKQSKSIDCKAQQKSLAEELDVLAFAKKKIASLHIGMPKLPEVTKDKGRCGPKFNAKMCTGGNFCNEANGWCGDTDAHRDAQESTMYDGAASKVCKDSPITIFTSQSKWTCAQYENYQWCKGGVIEQGWTKSQQKRFNAEEAVKNCCACGKNDGASAAAEKAAAEKAAAEKAAAEKAAAEKVAAEKVAAEKVAAEKAAAEKAAAEKAAAEQAKSVAEKFAAESSPAADKAAAEQAAAEQAAAEKFGA